MEDLLGLGEVVRRNSGAVRNRDVPLPPRLPSEALAYVSVAGLRTLQAQPYSPDFPVSCGTSVILGFRTCSPLRGSSGFSPGSLLMPLAEQPWRKPLYLGLLSTASPLDVDILLKEKVAQVLSSLSLVSETPPLCAFPCRAIGRLCQWLLLFRSVDLQLCSHRNLVPYDSLRSRAGSMARARRAGIQVEARPSSIMVRTTQESTSGSLVLGKDMRRARRRATSRPPMRPMHDPPSRMKIGRLSVERMT